MLCIADVVFGCLASGVVAWVAYWSGGASVCVLVLAGFVILVAA